MIYKKGQKVKTPLGMGEIVDIFTMEDKTISDYKVCIKNYKVWIKADDVEQYKSAHEKLLDLGFIEIDMSRYKDGLDFRKYVHNEKDLIIYFRLSKSDYSITKYEEAVFISSKLNEVCVQYLKEVEGNA